MKQKGFSLLEMIVVVLLFSILMQAVLGVFSSIYTGFSIFRNKVNYNDNARIVSDFIRDEIRLADKVRITVSDLGVNKAIDPKVTSGCLNVAGELKEIKLYTTDGTIGAIKLKANSGTNAKQGKYSLVYQADGSGTQNLISDLVDEMYVTRTTDSDYVTFEYVISKVGVTTTTAQLTQSFTESLAYKEKIN